MADVQDINIQDTNITPEQVQAAINAQHTHGNAAILEQITQVHLDNLIAVPALSAEIVALNTEITSLKQADEAIHTLLTDLQTQINNINTSGNTFDPTDILNDITALQTALTNLSETVDTNTTDITGLQSQLTALADLVGGGGDIDLSGVLADIQALQTALDVVENNLTAEISNREQAIADKQGQLVEINAALAETNRVLSTIHTSKTTATLNTTISGDTNVYFVDLSGQSAVNFSAGQSFVRDDAGTLAVVIAVYPDAGVTARTITTSEQEQVNLLWEHINNDENDIRDIKQRIDTLESLVAAGMPYGSIGEFTQIGRNTWEAELTGTSAPDNMAPVPFILDMGKIQMWQQGTQYPNYIEMDGNQFVVMYDGGVGERHIYAETNQGTPMRLTFTIPEQSGGLPMYIQMSVYIQVWDNDEAIWDYFDARTDDSDNYPVTIVGLQWIQLGGSGGGGADLSDITTDIQTLQDDLAAMLSNLTTAQSKLSNIIRDYFGDNEAITQADIDGFRLTTDNALASMKQTLAAIAAVVTLDPSSPRASLADITDPQEYTLYIIGAAYPFEWVLYLDGQFKSMGTWALDPSLFIGWDDVGRAGGVSAFEHFHIGVVTEETLPVGSLVEMAWTRHLVTSSSGSVFLGFFGQTIDAQDYPQLLQEDILMNPMYFETHFELPIVPVMTSNIAPAPFVISATSTWSNTWAPWMAFSALATNAWNSASGAMTNGVGLQQLAVNTGTPTLARGYALTTRNNAGGAANAPIEWTFDGSMDGVNWDILDTRSTDMLTVPGNRVGFILPNPVTYQHYRISVTRIPSGSHVVEIGQMQIFGGNAFLTTANLNGDGISRRNLFIKAFEDIQSVVLIPPPPDADGDYFLTAKVVGGVPSVEWVDLQVPGSVGEIGRLP